MKLFIFAPVTGNQFTTDLAWASGLSQGLKEIKEDLIPPGADGSVARVEDVDHVLAFVKLHEIKRLVYDPKDVVYFCTWDTMTATREDLDLLNQFKRVVVPSEASRKWLGEEGIDAAVVHPGVDPKVFWPDKLPHLRPRFFSMFEWVPRKYPQGILQAYCEEFARKEKAPLEADLFLKTWSRLGLTQLDFDDVVQHFNKGEASISVMTNTYEPQNMRDVFGNMDVFVSASKADSFSTSALQAMACGVPVVCPAGQGTDDLVDSACGWRYPSGVSEAVGFGDVRAGVKWGEPDIAALRAVLRRCVENPRDVNKKARAAAEKAREFTVAKTAQRLVKVLGGS